MSVTELDNFIQKFHQLWKAGHIAHLDVDTYAGKAWVGLRVQLGHVPGPPHHQFRPPPFSQVHKRKDTPSRQRRRARRTAERQVTIAEEAAIVESVQESVEEPDSSETDEHLMEETDEQSGNNEVNESDTATIEESNENNRVEIDNKAEEVITENEGTENEPIEPVTTHQADQAVVPPIVTIHATAVLDDSPNVTLTNDDVDSLVRILTAKDHLNRNISNIEYSHLSSREFRNKKYKHTVGLKIHVKTESLWEGPRNYLWKHIGQDCWDRRNGTVVTIVKIHQK